MPHRHLEHRLLRAVVDGQGAVDFGDLDIAHDAAAGYVQQGQVLLPFRFGELVGNGLLRQPGVIRAGGQPQLLVILLGQAGHAFRVAGDGLGLVEGVPVIAEGGVEHDGRPRQQDDDQQDGGQVLFHGAISLPRRAAGARGSFGLCLRPSAVLGLSGPGAQRQTPPAVPGFYSSSTLARRLVISRTTAATTRTPPPM